MDTSFSFWVAFFPEINVSFNGSKEKRLFFLTGHKVLFASAVLILFIAVN